MDTRSLCLALVAAMTLLAIAGLIGGQPAVPAIY
jgi:hypothetical protein